MAAYSGVMRLAGVNSGRATKVAGILAKQHISARNNKDWGLAPYRVSAPNLLVSTCLLHLSLLCAYCHSFSLILVSATSVRAGLKPHLLRLP